MANVCQKCGAVGYTDLLVYCSSCHKATQHQYCLDTIPNLDENIRWACGDCNVRAVKPNCFNNESNSFKNGQGVKILKYDIDFSAKPNAYSLQEWEKHFVSSNIKNVVISNLCDKDSHVHISQNEKPNLHMCEVQKLKAWGKTKRRAVRSKQTAEAYIDPLGNEGATSQPFESSKPNEDDFSMGDLEDFSLEVVHSFERSHPNDSIKGTTSLPPKGSIYGIKNDSSLEIDHSLEWSRPYGWRRKLILPNEGDDSMDENKKDTLLEYVDLEKMISIDQFFEKDGKPINLGRKLILSDEENGLNDLEARSLKDFEGGPILGKTNDEMTMKSNSDGRMNILASSKETILCLENNDPLVSSNQVDEHNGLQASLFQKKAKCLYDSTKMPSHIVVGDDEQLPNSPVMSNSWDLTSSQIEFYNMLASPMDWICWRGWFKISGRYYGPLIAHWSTKVGEKAWNATRSLPQIVELTMVSRSHAWPQSFKISPPTDGDIALFIFPLDSRVEKMVDLLLEEVIRCDLMLKVALDEADMLIFPSVLLPENYQRCQDKYYLWGVCKRKDSDTNTGEVTEIHQTSKNSTKQIVLKPLIESEELQREMGNEDMLLEGDELQESLCHLRDEGGDEEMGGDWGKDEELNGCLELFPMQAENIALRLKRGDGDKDVDLDLGLGLPYRQ